MFKTCNKCGKTYSTKECSCEKTKEEKNKNPYSCDLCGKPASVFPSCHNPRQYIIPELITPMRQYCEPCYYALVKKDHAEHTKLLKECPF